MPQTSRSTSRRCQGGAEKARKIIVTAIQRYAGNQTLRFFRDDHFGKPELKGRIIGREAPQHPRV